MAARHSRMLTTLITAGALACAGCGGGSPFKPLDLTPAATPPAADSPEGLLQRFQWALEHRDIAVYEGLFTGDYVFTYTPVEAVDNPPIYRDEEIAIARRMLHDGTQYEPPARGITVTLVNQLIPIPDTRPGKPDPWHKLIQTRVTLRVDLGDPVPILIDGDQAFFVVRGDSAVFSQEMRDRGLGPDSSRWYIERWEDHSGATSGSAIASDGARTVPMAAGSVYTAARRPNRFRLEPSAPRPGRER